MEKIDDTFKILFVWTMDRFCLQNSGPRLRPLLVVLAAGSGVSQLPGLLWGWIRRCALLVAGLPEGVFGAGAAASGVVGVLPGVPYREAGVPGVPGGCGG